MLNEEHERMMLTYLSSLSRGKPFHTAKDLAALPPRELLLLAGRVDDTALGLFVQLLKGCGEGSNLFEKLMGDHEEENRPLVDNFFNRYMNGVLSSVEENAQFNPLCIYMHAQTLDDLAFVQSRQAFFLRQTADTINEYLDEIFSGKHAFTNGEEEQAWQYFWQKVMLR